MKNNIWDEGQLGDAAAVWGPVDQLIIDRSIMEEVKTYHQNPDAGFYDCKKTSDNFHHN